MPLAILLFRRTARAFSTTRFDPSNHHRSDTHRKIYARTEIAYTAVEFAAAALFVAGSVLSFAAIWLFPIGSILFGVRPTIKLFRELAYARIDVAQADGLPDRNG